MEIALSAQNIAVGYNLRHSPVLQNIDFQVCPGEMLGIVGPNGSGKSTLVRTLSRVLPPQQGAVLLQGQNLYANVTARQSAQAIGVVPQTTEAALEFTVREIVEMGCAPRLGNRPFASPTPGDHDAVETALGAVGITNMASRLAPTLSGGEWQRVLLARALAQQTDILLLDEPTAHLDIHHQSETLTLARSLARKQQKAVVAVLHDLNLAAEFCDRLVLVSHGRIAVQGTPAEVLTDQWIAEVYGAAVWVRPHPLTGRPTVLSLPSAVPPLTLSHAGFTVHVLCGAGRGGGLLWALRQQGYRVTCGPLYTDDPDAELARKLDIPCVRQAPFTLFTPSTISEVAQLAASASAVVIADIPFGPLNLTALEAVRDAARAGVPVFSRHNFAADMSDTTQGESLRLWTEMRKQGAQSVPDDAAVLAALKALSESER